MAEPWIVITGATGFLGGQLVRQMRKDYRIYALGRRSPKEAGVPEGEGIEWFRADIGRMEELQPVFEHIRARGGAFLLLHLGPLAVLISRRFLPYAVGTIGRDPLRTLGPGFVGWR